MVRIDPAVIEIGPGDMATLTVVLADAQEVYGIDVREPFDPQLVEVVDADPAREGVQFKAGSFPRPDFLVRNEADNQAGTLHYAITQVNPTEPANGYGVRLHRAVPRQADSGEGAFTIRSGRVGRSYRPSAGRAAGERRDQDHTGRAGQERSAGDRSFCCW